MGKLTEAQLENAIIQLLGEQGYPHVLGNSIERNITNVLIKDDLRSFLTKQYTNDRTSRKEPAVSRR